MNIPDEVLNAAAVAWWRDYTDEDELDSMSPASAIAVREATEAAAEVIAEWARKEALSQVDLATYRAVEKAALDWGAPILAILSEEGHDHECDALVLEDAAHCDCWWGRVRDVATGMSEVALLARGQIERIEAEGAPDGQQ